MSSTEELIATRKATHGNWADQAAVAQRLKHILRSAPGWHALSDAQRESLEMNAVKMSRIVCGNPNEPDHWDDIMGYARLGKQGHEGI